MKMVELKEDGLRRQLARFKATEREATTREMTPISPCWGQPFSSEIDETPIPPSFREIVVEPFDGTQDPRAHLQAFQTQMYISGGSDQLSCKLFLGTLRGVAMQWMATLPARSIRTFGELAGSFVSQFAANKVKKLEVADLFDVKQGRGESLKSYLSRFNNATVQVDDPDQKFFVKAFQKGLRVGPFSDALALRKPSNMEEIRAHVEKHIEVEEDQLEQTETERNLTDCEKPTSGMVGGAAKGLKRPPPGQYDGNSKRQRAQILREICHTSLLEFPQDVKGRTMGPNQDEWCDFHWVVGHSTEECWTLRSQIEKLVQNGHLDRYVQHPTTDGRNNQNSNVQHEQDR
ncbi:hypothetical protein CR513_55986, partial [Mucuna pruriens]